MSRPETWRVRVARLNDEFVEVEAFSQADAEEKAKGLSRVISVYSGTAICGRDIGLLPEPPVGVRDE